MKKKLGKLPPRIDKRTLKLANFLNFDKLPELPDKIVWSEKVSRWPMMRNDEVGDCAIAGLAHIIESWSANESKEIILSDDQVVDAYSAICGYQRDNDQSDNGCVLLDVLNYWRLNGVHGHKIEGYVSINPQDAREVQMANYLFGAVYLGLNLPLAAQNNQEWTIPFKNPGLELAGSWGGHCLCPKTKILTSDLRWTSIENIKKGDVLLGFDENTSKNKRRKYKSSVVEETAIFELPCFEIEFSDGSILRASEDHQWLSNYGWIRTDKMTLNTKILKALMPWEEDESKDAGYLSAAFDGEGWIDSEKNRNIHKIGFAQKPNAMWNKVTDSLLKKGFKYNSWDKLGGYERSGIVNHLTLGNRQQLLKFLGSVRPIRLLSKFNPDKLGAIYGNYVSPIKITSIGIQQVIGLQTSSRTFLSEGFASHNCVIIADSYKDYSNIISWGQVMKMDWEFLKKYCDEAYAVFAPDDWATDGTAPNGFDIAQLRKCLKYL